jgi:hypothetical protein
MYTHESNKIKIHIARAWLNPVLRIGRIGCQLLPSWPSSALSHWQPRTLDTHIHITIRFDSLFLFYYFIFPGGRGILILHTQLRPSPIIVCCRFLFYFSSSRTECKREINAPTMDETEKILQQENISRRATLQRL